MDDIENAIKCRLYPELKRENMVFPEQVYFRNKIKDDFCLIQMSDFNSLIAISQECQTPVFALSRDEIGQAGNVLENTLRSQEKFKESFSELADKIINLTCNAVCA